MIHRIILQQKWWALPIFLSWWVSGKTSPSQCFSAWVVRIRWGLEMKDSDFIGNMFWEYKNGEIPSDNLLHSYGKWPCEVYLLTMVMFHSYVKLPDGGKFEQIQIKHFSQYQCAFRKLNSKLKQRLPLISFGNIRIEGGPAPIQHLI